MLASEQGRGGAGALVGHRGEVEATVTAAIDYALTAWGQARSFCRFPSSLLLYLPCISRRPAARGPAALPRVWAPRGGLGAGGARPQRLRAGPPTVNVRAPEKGYKCLQFNGMV